MSRVLPCRLRPSSTWAVGSAAGWALLVLFLTVLPARGASPPVLDGLIDDVYYSHGNTLDYQSFIPQGTAKLFVIQDTAVDSNFVWLIWSVGKTYNDLSYGDNRHYTWTQTGHGFGDLLESDMQRIWIFNKCGEVVVDASMDLIDSGYPSVSGYDVDMDSAESVKNYINGGDWSTNKYAFDTSFAANLNDFGYWPGDLASESPPWEGGDGSAGETNYIPDSAFSNWTYEVIWEMRVSRDVLTTATCPEGGLQPALILEPIELHASPNKPKVTGQQGNPPVVYVPAAIGDYVWLDVDRDGNQDIGEPGLPNVTLALYTDPNNDGDVSDGAIVDTTTTDANGRYLFDGLGSANYAVKVTDSNGVLTAYSATTGTVDPHPVALAVSETYLDADFGYAYADQTKAIIGDYVWADADNDGLQDPGEIGLGGVTLDLLDSDSNVIATATTDISGYYLFTNVSPGSYKVDVTDTGSVLTGYSLTSGSQSETDPSSEITVAAGDSYLQADFGYYKAGLGTIGNLVWLDTDLDGTNEAGEVGIDGVTVDLIQDSDGDGVWDPGEPVLATSITDPSGTYYFSGLGLDDGGGDGDADYLVHVTDVFGRLALLYYRSRGEDGLDGRSQADPYAVALSSGSPTNLTADFGFGRDSAGEDDGLIGDFVWYDLDGDGVQDPQEPGIEGVQIDLYQSGGGGGYLGTTGTDENGYYLFPSLDTSKDFYVIVAATNFAAGGALEGYEPTNQPDNQDETDPAFGAAPDNVDLTLDFGYEFTGTAVYAIGDLVWLDEDGDAVYDPGDGEAGIEGVTLQLKDAGGVVLASTTTDSSGWYTFTNLPNGQFTVQITDLDGRLAGLTVTTGADSQTRTVSDADNLLYDFGYEPGLKSTLVVLSAFGGLRDADGLLVYWETEAEVNTAGFHVERLRDGEFARVTDNLLPALIAAPQGGRYEFVDEGADPTATHVYRLVELETTGRTLLYGPFDVSAEGDAPAPAYGARARFRAQAHRPSARARARVAARRAALAPRSGKGRGAPEALSKSRAVEGERLRIDVTGEGLYYLSAADVAGLVGRSEAEIVRELDKRRWRILCRGRRVAYLPEDGGLYFYGTALDSIYTDVNVYWLEPVRHGIHMKSEESAAAAAAADTLTFREAAHFEEQAFAGTARFDDPEGDFWLWDWLRAGSRNKIRHAFELPGVDAAAEGRLRVYLVGDNDTPAELDHHAVFRINGHPVGEVRWAAADHVRASVNIPADVLVEGPNELEVENVLDAGVPNSTFYLNHFEVHYARRYEAVGDRLLMGAGGHPVLTVRGFGSDGIRVLNVGDPLAPRCVQGALVEPEAGGTYRVTFTPADAGGRYLAVASAAVPAPARVAARPQTPPLREPGNGARHVVVAVSDMIGAAEALAEHRRSQGLSAAVVDIADVYEGFNAGIVDPKALRSFIGYARMHWTPAPHYLVIAGAGSYDYKDFYGVGDCLVPPLMVPTPSGLCASDGPFADLDEDGRPDFRVGRLPVLTAAELSGVIAKIIAYEAGGAWKDDAVMVADNADPAGDFARDSDYVCRELPASIAPVRLYHGIDPPGVDVRTELLAWLRRGCRIVNYVGHGAIRQLADEGFLKTGDVAELANADRAAVVAAMTCSINRFGFPGYDCLGEALVASPQGAVGVFGPVSMAHNVDSVALDQEFFRSLFAGGQGRLGDAIVAAFAAYLERDRSATLTSLYTLLGDPATVIGEAAPPPAPEDRPAATFENWQRWAFGPGERVHEDVAGRAADPDGDNICNFLEYAQGLDPKTAQGPSLRAVLHKAFESGAWREYLKITYRRRRNAAALDYAVQICEDLNRAGWTGDETDIEEVGRKQVDGSTEEVTVRVKDGLSPGRPVFVRLRVTSTP